MSGSRSDTAAIEIHGPSLVAAGEHDAAAECVAALSTDQPGFDQHRQRVAEAGKVSSQVSAGGVANTQPLNEIRIAQASLVQILDRLAVAMELELVKGSCSIQQFGFGNGCQAEFFFQMGDSLTEGKIEVELREANQIAATAATIPYATGTVR
jgi:hypothetical protein